MEIFAAVARFELQNWDAETLIEKLRQAVQRCAEGQEVKLYQSPDFIFACSLPRGISDTHIQVGASLVYINGHLLNLEHPQSAIIDYESALAASDPLRTLQTLSGSFCALQHNVEFQRTTITTDRLASHLVFTARIGGMMSFASDIRCLLWLPGMDTSLDLEGVAQLIRGQCILEDRTLYRAIRTLPPACNLTLDFTGSKTQIYWSLQRLEPYKSPQEAIDETARVFSDSMGRIVRGYQKISLLLSGGMDSRMVLAALLKHVMPEQLVGHTFDINHSYETVIAEMVAKTVGMKWEMLPHGNHYHIEYLPDIMAITNGLYSFYHGHTFNATVEIAAEGYDTIIDSWGLDLFYSGSYLPKHQIHILGRSLNTYSLDPLEGTAQTLQYIHKSLDNQRGEFERSLLGQSMKSVWEISLHDAIQRLLLRAQQSSDVPYDWVDDVLFSFGVAKFRSYPMILGSRSRSRQRNPMFENDVLEIYQRLPYRWRFLGPIFRRAIQKLNPALIAVPYSNTHISPLAPPLLQAASLEWDTFRSANQERLRKLAQRVAIQLPASKSYGNYSSTFQVAAALVSGQTMPRHWTDNQLIDTGVVDKPALMNTIRSLQAGVPNSAETFLTYISLCTWLEVTSQF